MDKEIIDLDEQRQRSSSDMDYPEECDPCKQDLMDKEAVCYCGVCKKTFCQSCSQMHTKILREHSTVLMTRGNDGEEKRSSNPTSNLNEKMESAVQRSEFQDHLSISVKLPDDKERCHVTGCCYLPNGTVVIVDNYNRKLKLLTEDKYVVDAINLPEKPNVACVVTNDIIALTMNDSVLLVSVKRQGMTITAVHPMKHECHCIAHYGDKLYVGDSQRIYEYSMACRPLGIFYSNLSHHKSVKYFLFRADGERVYITNEAKSQIVVLDKIGKTLTTIYHPSLTAPRGICSDTNNNIYVCGYQSSTVIKIEASGYEPVCFLKKTDGIVSPISICFDCAKNELLIGQWKHDFMVSFPMRKPLSPPNLFRL